MPSEETINFHFSLWLSGVKDDSSCVALKKISFKQPKDLLSTVSAHLALVIVLRFHRAFRRVSLTVPVLMLCLMRARCSIHHQAL